MLFTRTKSVCCVRAVVTRADGSIEDLGIVAHTEIKTQPLYKRILNKITKLLKGR